jgi:predicted metal-dependent hydrolase
MSTSTLTISNLGSVTFAKSPRAKYQRITVRPDKTITVTIPRGGSLSEAKQFLKSKISWIQKQLQKIDQNIQCRDMPDLKIDLEEAQINLFHRLDEFSEKYNFPYNRSGFRCQKTRWGSCSGKNNISLNVNIAFLPEELQDYVLLHELVHTKVKNHSRKFWAELDKYTQGQAKELSKELKKYRIRLRV